MVDARDIKTRRNAPIDRLPALQREAWTKPKYQRGVVRTGKKRQSLRPVYGRDLYKKPGREGVLFGRKTYTRTELEEMTRTGKVPSGDLMEYPQYYMRNLTKDQKYKRVIPEERGGEYFDEDYQGDSEDIDEEKIRTFNKVPHYTVYSAIESPEPDPVYYEVGDQVHKASFIDRVFYFTSDNAKTIPID